VASSLGKPVAVIDGRGQRGQSKVVDRRGSGQNKSQASDRLKFIMGHANSEDVSNVRDPRIGLKPSSVECRPV